MVHYHNNIKNFGAPNGLCSSITESKHITAVKHPWCRSNQYKALSQILKVNERLDRLESARVDFANRGMLAGPISEGINNSDNGDGDGGLGGDSGGFDGGGDNNLNGNGDDNFGSDSDDDNDSNSNGNGGHGNAGPLESEPLMNEVRLARKSGKVVLSLCPHTLMIHSASSHPPIPTDFCSPWTPDQSA